MLTHAAKALQSVTGKVICATNDVSSDRLLLGSCFLFCSRFNVSHPTPSNCIVHHIGAKWNMMRHRSSLNGWFAERFACSFIPKTRRWQVWWEVLLYPIGFSFTVVEDISNTLDTVVVMNLIDHRCSGETITDTHHRTQLVLHYIIVIRQLADLIELTIPQIETSWTCIFFSSFLGFLLVAKCI